MRLTLDQKCALYYAGKYRCSPPPVPHGKWSHSDWIRYIDEQGHWITKDLVDHVSNTVADAAEFEAVTKGHVPAKPSIPTFDMYDTEDMKDRD